MRNKAGAAASPPRGPESRETAENRAFWAPDRAPGPLRHGARSERRDIEQADIERRDGERRDIERRDIEPQASSPRHRARIRAPRATAHGHRF